MSNELTLRQGTLVSYRTLTGPKQGTVVRLDDFHVFVRRTRKGAPKIDRVSWKNLSLRNEGSVSG